MNRLPTNRLLILGTLTLLGACSQDRPMDAPDSDMAMAMAEVEDHGDHDSDGTSRALGEPWTVTASNGSHVTLATEGAVFSGMPFVLAISVDDPSGRSTPVSIDIVSPEMPMHGLVRIPVTDGEARVQIPMDGEWAIYVNLDADGAVSAEFLFDVSPGDAGGDAHRGQTPAP